MDFHDITNTDIASFSLRIKPRVFFLMNRSGNFTFSFGKSGVDAHIFAIFIGTQEEDFRISLTQLHRAPGTSSHVTILSLLNGRASIQAHGLVHIENAASGSIASQSHQTLLLSQHARSQSTPSLKIHAEDVSVRHASSTGSPNHEALFFLQSLGLSEESSKHMCAIGLARSFFDGMRALSNSPEIDGAERTALNQLSEIG